MKLVSWRDRQLNRLRIENTFGVKNLILEGCARCQCKHPGLRGIHICSQGDSSDKPVNSLAALDNVHDSSDRSLGALAAMSDRGVQCCFTGKTFSFFPLVCGILCL